MLRQTQQQPRATSTSRSSALLKVSIIREAQALRQTIDWHNHESKVNLLTSEQNVLTVSANSSKDNDEKQKVGTKLAYKDMNDCYYYFATISYQVVVVFAACAIPHVDIVFNLVEVLCVNCISFFFPATFYLLAASKKQKKEEAQKLIQKDDFEPRNRTLEACAYVTFILGLIAFVLGGIDNIQELKALINSE